ncbi:polysaccharide deacetylase family protein [Paenibacillus sp. PR3]|uniref:Polysaccharide deacetylase family protein n=1 Tax=Paenibacillus terricola TaxID=2763503 RepID=A0ABR8N095_9BACL|nr:polysaccharide deacetylase family protein [Paenibacillus terricola]MBD3920204.1 polysaccharide deacetylase family protein [Paenibacillus terricola]
MKRQARTCLLVVLALMLAYPTEAAASPSAARHEVEDRAAVSIENGDALHSTEQRNSYARPRKKQRKQAAMSWVSLEKRYPGAFVTHGPRSVRRAALTFDDVPDPRYTGKVLDVLARHKVKATFFVVGSLASRYPALVRRMEREGHTVGNHSYNHAVFSQLTTEQYRRQITRTDAILAPLVGYSPRYIRPPYGEIRSTQVQWAKRNGYVVVNWDVDSVDWRSLRSRSVIINVKKTLQPGSIILQHAGGGSTQDLSGTVEALPVIIRMLRNKGYELVTIPEMLGSSDGRRQ